MRRSQLMALVLCMTACREPPRAQGPATTTACVECHRREVEAVAQSHHALGQRRVTALRLPSGSVNGFELRALADAGFDVSFSLHDGGFSVAHARYAVGVDPLVQLAVELPDGRLQVPPIAWRPDAGWYTVPSAMEGEAREWMTPPYNWSASCAPCHATGFRQHNPTGADTSSWRALDVTCEACHGESDGHRAWFASGAPPSPGHGFATPQPSRAPFAFVDGGSIARLVGAPRGDSETAICAACHSRRRALTDDGALWGPLFDRFEPALMTQGLYAPSGALLDEVFETGSFHMSRMYSAGVRCTDCHDPHTATLRAVGNLVCTRCHAPAVFDVTSHHAHASNTEAATCVGCHMATATFLGVDVRHDHAFQVPTASNASSCRRCHTHDAKAANWLKSRPPRPSVGDDVAKAFEAAFGARADARVRLLRLSERSDVPVYQRASALALLAEHWGPSVEDALRNASTSPDDWLRYGAARALGGVPIERRWAVGAALLDDSRRAIRVQAARVLAGLGPTPRLAEAFTAESANAPRGDAALNTSAMQLATGDVAAAERTLRDGLNSDSAFTPLAINLADLLRRTGRDSEGLDVLEAARRRPGPWASDVDYALGLARWRAKRIDLALPLLASAARGNVRFGATYAEAIRSTQGVLATRRVLRELLALYPNADALLELSCQWAESASSERRCNENLATLRTPER